jgi:peptide/nickel transport system ATP-binding protein
MLNDKLRDGLADSPRPGMRESLLIADRLSKTYKQPSWGFHRNRAAVAGLKDVSLRLQRAQTLAIIGESGAGKSTLGRCIACLDLPDEGQLWLDGLDLLKLGSRALRTARRHIQMIFQGAAASLNPKFSALEAVREPVMIAGLADKADSKQVALAMMERVGLPRSAASRRCSEFSGGERQRLAIARAISIAPKVLILDESLTGLDLLVQAQLLDLLFDLQASLSVSYIFITHDVRLAANIADYLAVMQHGRIVEHGPSHHVSKSPEHPHTHELLAAARQFDLYR